MKCSTPNCDVYLREGYRGTVCLKCRSAMPPPTLEKAQATIPSSRTRADWTVIRDYMARRIQCCLALSMGVGDLPAIYNDAVEALSVQPVTIDPFELARLKTRSALLADIEAEIRPALAPHRDHNFAGQHLLDWFRRSSILRGHRI